jgi:predicted NBD/HSP70 family sugar kinase
VGVPLLFGLQRSDGKLSHFETRVYPEDHPLREKNLLYAERILKFILWQRGGNLVYVGGPHSIGEYLEQCYSPGGTRDFDYHFMGEQVYEQAFHIVPCEAEQVPPANDPGVELGFHFEGCRVGFDLGASDRKVSAVIDGQVTFSEAVTWEPRNQPDPEYHYNEIMRAIKSAASRMPRIDAVGGSSAGIILNNRPMVASLFRGIPRGRYSEVRNLFLRIRDELRVPLEVINDGDVTALAGAMALKENGILGIAMGSSQAAGYIDMQGRIVGWLNELAFAPIDYNPDAPYDEWSGDRGCGAQYLSQQCVFRLAGKAGIQVPSGVPDAEKLEFVQRMLDAGHEGADQIWKSIGIYLGYALGQYARFYDLRHVLILGRCTAGLGGHLIVEEAEKVLKGEFPELASCLTIQIPDERDRRFGQAIAAASLPKIDEYAGTSHDQDQANAVG